MACIIHYKQFNNVTKLVDLNEQTYKTLIENKQIRTKLGGDSFHAEQSLSIPDSYKNGLKYHRECYQKFSYAKTLYKRYINFSFCVCYCITPFCGNTITLSAFGSVVACAVAFN